MRLGTRLRRIVRGTVVLVVIGSGTLAGAVSAGAATMEHAGLVAAADTPGVLSWSSPAPANGSATDGGLPVSVSCPTPSFCVALTVLKPRSGGEPGILVSENPPAGETGWTAYALPAAANDSVSSMGISCPTTTLCVVVSYGVIFTSTDPAGGATTWDEFPAPQYLSPDIACPTTTLCVALGSYQDGGFAVSTNPTKGLADWTYSYSNSVPGPLDDLSCPNAKLCVGIAGSQVFSTTDPAGGASAWSATGAVLGSTDAFDSLSCVGSTDSSFCAAFDGAGNLVTTDDPTADDWSSAVSVDPQTQSETIPTNPMVSCFSATLCVGSDAWGNLLSSSDPAGGAGDWTVENLPADGGTDLSGLECPTSSFCLGFTSGGDEVISTDPTGPASSWKVTTPSIVPAGISSISCPAPDLCVAASAPLQAYTPGPAAIVVSTNPSVAGSWQAVAALPDTTYSAEVSCPSTSLCVITDGEDIVTSTHPTGGASAWTTTTDVDSSLPGFDDIDCPTTSLCVATAYTGAVFTSTDPTGGAAAWAGPVQISSVDTLYAVSCPSTTMCALAGSYGVNGSSLGDGYVVTSTDPRGGVGAWTAQDVGPMLGAVSSITCPSTSECVAAQGGNYVVSSDPTGGASAWEEMVPFLPGVISGIVCPDADLCFAQLTTGDVATTTQPLTVGYPWTVQTGIDGVDAWPVPSNFASIACPSTDLCVAVDTNGYFVAGTAPNADDPAVAADPTNFVSDSGGDAAFSAKAAGGASIRVQWQSSTNGGRTYKNVAGATSDTLRFRATSTDADERLRAEFIGKKRDAFTTAATLQLHAREAPKITTHASATVLAGKHESVTIRTVGVPTALLTERGRLPKGLAFTNVGEGRGLIWGVPARTSAGTYHVKLQATDAVGVSRVQDFTLTVKK